MTHKFELSDFLKLNENALPWAKWPGATQEDKEKDFALFKKLQDDIINRPPGTGHAVRFPDGDVLYLYKIGDHYQFTRAGSFYIGNGYTSYSGGFDWKHETIHADRIGKKVGETMLSGWFPHKGDLCAHCAVYAEFRVPIWEVKK